MDLCDKCSVQIGEAVQNWLVEDYEGGVIASPEGHYDHVERRDCPPFLFHWAIEDMDDVDIDGDEDDE